MMRDATQLVSLVVLVVASLFLISGCDDDDPAGALTPSPSSPVTREASDDHARLAVTVDKETLRTIETIDVRIEISRPKTAELEPFDIEPFMPEAWSIARRSQQTTPPTDDDTHRTTVYDFELEPFLPTTVETLGVAIRYRLSANDAWVTLSTDPFAIAVSSVLPPDTNDPNPADIKEIVAPPTAFASSARTWGIILGAALLLSLAGWWLWRSRGRRAQSGPRTRPLVHLPAAAVAHARLELLQSQHLVERAEFKAFYNEVSLVLRRYIEDRFGIEAPERTTEEFLHDARRRDVLRVDDVVVLERFLGHCDMVKFAEFQPTVQQARDTADTVRDFVNRTSDERVLVGLDADDPVVDIASRAADDGSKGRAA